jgi:predicted tellurium resistance membrane protein TerC
MLELFLDPQTYISLLSLTLLEIVLGIDNIIFISILAGKLPEEQRQKARVIGLLLALAGRLLLLFSIAWLTKLTQPLFTIFEFSMSGKDLVMLAGGLFLIGKSAVEIYEKVEGGPHEHAGPADVAKNTFAAIIVQIILIDVVFSLDSIITAVGLVSHIAIMVVAILISLGVMIAASGTIGGFIDRHPSIKVLALSFLLMIGTMLMADGLHFHIPKGYIYFSLSFALFVEVINIKAHSRKHKSLPKT